jgi:uncharacterized protein (TIGR00255 family)
MIRSMTGFGRGVAAQGGTHVTIDVRSVNHRYLDVSIRLPKEYAELEPEVRGAIKAAVSRGRVDVFVNRIPAPTDAGALAMNRPLAAAFCREARKLAKALDLSGEITLETVLAQRGVVELREPAFDLDAERPAVFAALARALKGLARMQGTEGRAIRKDLLGRIEAIDRWRKEVRGLLPGIETAARARLGARLAEAGADEAAAKDRIAQEMAVLLNRGDITEELVRLKSHLAQMRALLSIKEPGGRKLDFLLQEANREATTIGSKANSSDVSARVVAIKAELEKVREQAQNIE